MRTHLVDMEHPQNIGSLGLALLQEQAMPFVDLLLSPSQVMLAKNDIALYRTSAFLSSV